MVIYYTHGWIHLSIGKPNRWFRWGIIEFVVTCTLLVIGLSWGPIGVAGAWTFSFWILTIPAIWYAGRPINFDVSQVLIVVWKYIVASFAAAVLTMLIVRNLSFLKSEGTIGGLTRIAANSVGVAFFYVGIIVLLHGGFRPLYRIARVAREVIPRAKLVAKPKGVGKGEAVADSALDIADCNASAKAQLGTKE